jgi:ATP-binding cassette, subfamily B, bacterial
MVWSAGSRELATAVGLQILGAVLLAGQVLVVGQLLGSVLTSQNQHDLRPTLPSIALLVGLLGAAGIASAVEQRQQQMLTEMVTRNSAGKVLDVTTAVSLEAFDRPAFHDRLTRAMASQGRPFQLTQSLFQLIRGGVNMVGVAVALWLLQPLLIPLVILAFLPLALTVASSGRDFFLFSSWWTPQGRLRSYMQMLLMGKETAKEVRAFNLGGFLRRVYEQLYDEYMQELRKVTRTRLLRTVGSTGLAVVLVGALVTLLVWLVVNGSMGLAQAGAALTALIFLGFSLPQVLFAASQLYECAFFIDDYQSFVALRPAAEADTRGGEAPAGFSRLTVDNVSFVYPTSGAPALCDVSMEISRGEVVALVGENGSGKTTLAKLLCQLYAPSSGRILWDGADTASMDSDAVRKSIALIFQDFVQYQLPARQNIAAGRHERFDDLEGIRAAARHSGADEFLAALPEGYETMLGPIFEGGQELSIGQWQRVALARAFFRDAPFIILDEPTAALDPRSEHQLFDRIRELTAGRSVLLISHRFSSVRAADRIYVLKHGKVVEHGSHSQLMAQGGLYAELFALQASAYLDASEA